MKGKGEENGVGDELSNKPKKKEKEKKGKEGSLSLQYVCLCLIVRRNAEERKL